VSCVPLVRLCLSVTIAVAPLWRLGKSSKSLPFCFWIYLTCRRELLEGAFPPHSLPEEPLPPVSTTLSLQACLQCSNRKEREGVTPSSKTRRSAQSWYHPRCQQWKPGGWRGEFEGMPSAKANGPGWPSFPSASHSAQRMSPMQALHTLRGTAVRAQNACVAMKATAFAIAEPNRLPLEGSGVELTQGPGSVLTAPCPALRRQI